MSLWAMCAMTLLPVVLLSSPLVTRVARRAPCWLLALAIVFPVLMVLAAPVIAIWIHREGVPNYATHYRLLAQRDRQGLARDDRQRRCAISAATPTSSMACRSICPTGPRRSTSSIRAATPWADAASVARAGIALVCPEPEAICMQLLECSARATCRATP